MKIHLTSGGFRSGDWRRRLDRCRAFAEHAGWEFGVQLHNTASDGEIAKFAAAGVELSAHAPLAQPRVWNLARPDASETLRAIDGNIRKFREIAITAAVFHGALMTDSAPEAFGHGKSYHECMQSVYRPELARFPGKPLNDDFTAAAEFRTRYELLKKNMALLRERYPDMLICLENDFPAYSSMNMFFRDLVTLDCPLCLDTGHLWISTHLAGIDFQSEVELAADSGRLRMCHFHESPFTSVVPPENWSDGHRKLTGANREMDLPRVLRTLVDGGLNFFVLEINGVDVDDLEVFRRWLDGRA